MTLDICALLLSDTYKQTHDRMYPADLKYLTSYWVPRKSMLSKENQHMVFFGLQPFIKYYLQYYFTKNFFERSWEWVEEEYTYAMNIQLGEGNYDIQKIKDLHDLGYLPLVINTVPEGTLVPMGCPCLEVSNTKPGFAWLVQWIECILQVELWKTCNDATIGHMYHKLAEKWYNNTVDDGISPYNAFSNFDMRGDDNMEAACRTGAAWLLSSNKTSTIPTIKYVDTYYNADCKNNGIGVGAISTEHSVMGADFSKNLTVIQKRNGTIAFDSNGVRINNATQEEKDEAERETVRKLLQEKYPTASFSMVSDTYDYWNMVENIIPSLKDEILTHKGKLLLRPDSGDMVEITIRTIQSLWNTFGGTINSKGYKVLDSHIGLIYGDGCVIGRLSEIWTKLAELGFAANNVVFGIGAFCFKAVFEPNAANFVVNTRDTFGIAMKATHGLFGDEELFIFKDPKTDTSKLKKSHKGLIAVRYDENGELVYKDGLCFDEYEVITSSSNCAMQPAFLDGKLLNEEDFMTIRKRLAE